MRISRVRVSGIRVWRISQDPPFVFDSIYCVSVLSLCLSVRVCALAREGRKERTQHAAAPCFFVLGFVCTHPCTARC
jgi:hypothetical protein